MQGAAVPAGLTGREASLLCSDVARALGVDPVGTAVDGGGYLLVDVPRP